MVRIQGRELQMIGKIFHQFSNDWKNFLAFFGNKKNKRPTKQLGTTLSWFAAQPGGGRQRKGPSNRRLGGATFQSRPSGWSVGGAREERSCKNVSNAASRTRRDGKGEELNIENHENRFADMESGREADVQSGRGRPGPSGPRCGRRAREGTGGRTGRSPDRWPRSSCTQSASCTRNAAGRFGHVEVPFSRFAASSMRRSSAMSASSARRASSRRRRASKAS